MKRDIIILAILAVFAIAYLNWDTISSKLNAGKDSGTGGNDPGSNEREPTETINKPKKHELEWEASKGSVRTAQIKVKDGFRTKYVTAEIKQMDHGEMAVGPDGKTYAKGNNGAWVEF